MIAACSSTTSPKIVAVVKAGPSEAGLAETLQSLLAAGIPAVVTRGRDEPSQPELGLLEGAWLMPLTAGDVLRTGASGAYRTIAATADAKVIYADDDLLDPDGQRTLPHFKPQWNSELFRNFDYLTGACIVRVDAEDLGELSGANWAHRLIARSSTARAPIHIPKILHHRRSRPRPRVLTAALAGGSKPPQVTVIIPTRNRIDLLQACIGGLERTDYPNLDVIVVDNDSDDTATLTYLAALDPRRYRILRHSGPFNFSAMNNRAIAKANGELLCLLNNDIEVIEPGWLRAMSDQAMREDVGAVGARLLYPDGRVQHAGVVLGIGGGAAHAHRLLHPAEEGYFHRHSLPQFVSAVTAACLVVQRERLLAVGGFDERNFAVAFNDVDLCMRLNERGWRSLYEPRATLIHHESVSRGLDRDAAGAARLAGELAALKRRWSTGSRVDPFHHAELSPFSERFVVRL